MRVSLSPKRRALPGDGVLNVPALLEPSGARVILGQKVATDGLADPIRPAADSLFGPRGATLGGSQGPLFVCDTGHHRLMIWNATPKCDGTRADLLIGQPDFKSEGRNGKADVGPATLNVPTGVAAADGILAVADAWNHRVLIWHGYPKHSNQPADVVLGQADFKSGLANRGARTASADTLNWCYGVAIENRALYVADTGNRRVLKWNAVPVANGTPADLVLGETDFVTRDENAGRTPDAMGMRWPHGIVVHRNRLMVADAGNNRIMVWDRMPKTNGAPCTFVLGQSDCSGVDHNQVAYYPTPASLNMPYGLAVLKNRLITADTANCRIVAYDLDALAMNMPACGLAGQRTFQDKGENGWGLAGRDSLCWPYGVAASDTTVVVADSGNNRVLLWDGAP
ncbi:MAG: NHL repeat-containing protein [Hyphomicrobium sp.]